MSFVTRHCSGIEVISLWNIAKALRGCRKDPLKFPRVAASRFKLPVRGGG